MSHEIGRMFYFGEVPWHGLGIEIPQPATLTEALTHGELDWTVELVPLLTNEDPPSRTPQRMAVVRSDRKAGEPGRVLGVVHPEFRPLQNRDGAELFDRLFDPRGRKYHTGGWLRNGEVVWLLARLPGEINLGDGDVVEPYLLYSNSHNGSQAIDIRLTAVRVVCRNTLSFALGGAVAGRAFRRAHREGPARLEERASRFFAFVRRRLDEIADSMRLLAAASIDDGTFAHFVWHLLPDPPRPGVSADNPSVAKAYATRLENLALARAAIERIRSDGVPELGIPPEPATWWGALNALTAWADHLQPVSGDRYAHALFGGGDRFKTRVFGAATAWSTNRVVSMESKRQAGSAPLRGATHNAASV